MELQKEYEDIVENLNHESFDSLMSGLEKLLDILERKGSNENIDEKFIVKVSNKASEVKNEAAILLKKQRDDIVGLADLFGITLADPPNVE